MRAHRGEKKGKKSVGGIILYIEHTVFWCCTHNGGWSKAERGDEGGSQDKIAGAASVIDSRRATKKARRDIHTHIAS